MKAQTQTPWWHGAVIYQIYPRSFLDTNDDGIGDLKGIIEGLDHIASLGVDAVWISPFFTSPMHDFGYDVSDYCDVDPIFGTLADFDALIGRAHALGLKIIIDQVYSHTSDQHNWFEASRQDAINDKADWYVWAAPKPDGSPPNNWQSVFGGSAWAWDGRRKQYYLHNFLTSQPDLNLHNLDVQNALLDVARFWLDRGVDGFRLDAINFAMHDPRLFNNPPSNLPMKDVTRGFDMQLHKYNQSHRKIPEFLSRMGEVHAEYDDVFTVAEVVGPDPLKEMRAFTRPGRLSSAYNFDFLYLDQITAEAVKSSLSPWLDTPKDIPSWAFSNHDAPRIATRWGGHDTPEDRAKLYMMLLLSLPGNVFIYQGEELALPQGEIPFEKLVDPEAIENWPHTLGRDGARTPIPWNATKPNGGFSKSEPWLPISREQLERSVSTQEEAPSSTLHFTREALQIRRSHPALRLGQLKWIESPKDTLVFTRTYNKQTILCAFNLSDDPKPLPPQLVTDRTVLLSKGPANREMTLPAQTGIWWQA